MSHAPGLIQITKKQVQHVTQARGSPPHAMRKVKPTLLSFDWYWSQSVLYFLYCVVLTFVNAHLFVDEPSFNLVPQTPTDPAASSSLDEVVLRSCVESILSADKLGMQNNVSLLR